MLVCTDRDDTNVLVVLTARHSPAKVRIIARVEEPENEKQVEAKRGRRNGFAMADSLESSALLKYVMDLISAGGNIVLEEREASAEDVGRSAEELPYVVRVMRAGQVVGLSGVDAKIRSGDKLITVRPVAGSAAGTT